MKWIVLTLTLSLNILVYAPVYKNLKINIKTINELKIIKKENKRLKIVQAADFAAFCILDKFKRKKSDKQHRAFVKKVQQVADSLNIHFSWLVEIMRHESRLNHKALNSIRAVGLIQFLPSTAKGLGTNTNALYNMSDVQQLDYVYKFYKHAKDKFKQMSDVHLYAFFPIAVLNNWPDNKVIQYGKLTANIIVKYNPGFDTNKDGKITIKEFRQEVIKHSPKEIISLGNQFRDEMPGAAPKLH